LNGLLIDNLYFKKKGIYTLSLENSCGKEKQNTYASFDDCNCEVIVPNTFTPNQDLTNDVFQCYSACSLNEYQLRIYNHLGNVVFESQNINYMWFGKDELSEIYIYKVTFSEKENNKLFTKTIRGNAALIGQRFLYLALNDHSILKMATFSLFSS
jgi:gliding motility-associated-like protein